MKYEQFLETYNKGPEAVYQLVTMLMESNTKLSEQVTILEARVKDLEERLNQNSGNSSKPPSSDEFVKPKSRRKKSGKKSGGQKGHKGQTLKMSDTPDSTITYPVETCQGCGKSLDDTEPKSVEKRQVFDLPPLKIDVTEHRAESKVCSCCGVNNKASFPEAIELPVQYGHNLKAFLVYLNQYQMLPYERSVELLEDVCGHSLSQGTLYNAIRTTFKNLESVEANIIEQLTGSPVINVDETGMRVENKRQWVHVASTENLTHYAHHPKRGSTATDDIGILPQFNGLSVHDFWKPYLTYSCNHALCNAHHIRELTGILESTGQQWPEAMIELLLEINDAVESRKSTATKLEPAEIESFEQRYQQIIEKGFKENPPPPEPSEKKRGRKKQSKAKNLLDRLNEYRSETLAFMYHFHAPFDNNLAERDLRMIKVKQKISGVFRSNQGAKMFCRIRSYISTARKNSIPVIDALKNAMKGKPFIPDS